ncbi:unnamed protein product [Orchesella dallaii]|uniref:Uncharacterized protein n=1 Tax=Orchesella dallaii TaxID=48710 RepID=A0ABP1RNR8_9HEXA
MSKHENAELPVAGHHAIANSGHATSNAGEARDDDAAASFFVSQDNVQEWNGSQFDKTTPFKCKFAPCSKEADASETKLESKKIESPPVKQQTGVGINCRPVQPVLLRPREGEIALKETRPKCSAAMET